MIHGPIHIKWGKKLTLLIQMQVGFIRLRIGCSDEILEIWQ